MRPSHASIPKADVKSARRAVAKIKNNDRGPDFKNQVGSVLPDDRVNIYSQQPPIIDYEECSIIYINDDRGPDYKYQVRSVSRDEQVNIDRRMWPIDCEQPPNTNNEESNNTCMYQKDMKNKNGTNYKHQSCRRKLRDEEQPHHQPNPSTETGVPIVAAVVVIKDDAMANTHPQQNYTPTVSKNRIQTKIASFIYAISFIVATAIIAGVVCGLGTCTRKNSNDSKTNDNETTVVAAKPSLSIVDPTIQMATLPPEATQTATRTRNVQIQNFLINFNISLSELIFDSTTPQYAAIEWMASIDPYELNVPTSANDKECNRFVQRYVAAVLYFSAHKDGSLQTLDIKNLQNNHECLWNQDLFNFQIFCPLNNRSFGIYCDQNTVISQITLPCSGINRLPSEIGFLSNGLQHITLENNGIVGKIPDEFSRLSLLQSLNLSWNMISGVLPSSFGLLTSLEELVLQHNILEGSLAELKTLPALNYLMLDDNLFTGSFIDNFFAIGTVSADNNLLSGTLPTVPIESASYNIEQLSLQSNFITGSIPLSFGLLTNLNYLDLSLNQLSDYIPDIFHSLASLRVLSLAQNNFFSGSIPITSTSVTEMYLDDTNRTGSIPIELVQYSKLRILNLARNKLTGSIPALVGRLSMLEHLHLNQNSFSGRIYIDLTQLKLLKSLHLEQNHFTNGFSQVCNDGYLLDFIEFVADCGNSTNDCWCCTYCCDDVSCPSANNTVPSGI